MALGKSLGNILDDYFGESQVTLFNQQKELGKTDGKILVEEIEIAQIGLNPYQTRKEFDPKKINSLAKNIQTNGLIHPILVLKKKQIIADSKNPDTALITGLELENQIQAQDLLANSTKKSNLTDDKNLKKLKNQSKVQPENKAFIYSLLAGERRLRAIESLGETKILAIIKTEESLNSEQQAMLTAMENLQRENLNALELAQTFEMLLDTQKLSEQKLAEILDSSEQYIKNYLRLLSLPQIIKKAIVEGKIGEGQARNLVGLSEDLQIQILQEILDKDLTVKEIVILVKKMKSPEKENLDEKPILREFQHTNAQEIIKKVDKIASLFPQSKMKCSGDESKGKIVISWG